MKKYTPLYSMILMLFFIVACNGQKKVEPPKEVQQQAEDGIVILPEIDPYFTESNKMTSVHGPRSITRNVLQDKYGNFWFATWEGIFGYDGKIFTNYTNKKGLRRFRAFSLLEDSAGNIWFGTIGAGVYRFDGQHFTNLTDVDGLVHNDVGCIYEDKKGNIWFGTRVGLSCYDGKIFKNFTTEDGLTDNDINSIIEDQSGKMWFAARGNACTYDGKTFTTIKREDGSPFINARTVIQDKKGNIWLGGNDGIWCFDGEKFKNLKKNFTGYLYQDSKESIWASISSENSDYQMVMNQIVPAYEQQSISIEKTSIQEVVDGKGQVFGIMEDAAGHIWFGTERGVCRYDGKSFLYYKDAVAKE